MIGANPIGAPLKRCNYDQRQCLTIQQFDNGTADLYDDAVEGGPHLNFPVDEVRQFILHTAEANPGFNSERAEMAECVVLPRTQRIRVLYSPITGGWVITDRDSPQIELNITPADARMFVVGAVDGTFAAFTEREAQLVS